MDDLHDSVISCLLEALIFHPYTPSEDCHFYKMAMDRIEKYGLSSLDRETLERVYLAIKITIPFISENISRLIADQLQQN